MSTHHHLDDVVASIQKRWGDKALRRLEQVPTGTGIPTGCADLDRLFGVGGLPRGAVTCLSGHPTSGKTTLALDMLARVQGDGEVTVYIDMTGALDAEYAETRGIDLDRLLIVWPQPPALGLDIARDLIRSGGAGLVVVDTGDCLPGGPGPRAVPVSLAARRSPYALVCLTDAPGSMSMGLMARADVHLRVERQRWLCNVSGINGYEARITLLKSRFGPPGQAVTLPIRLFERRLGP